jgi:hypothetical protein
MAVVPVTSEPVSCLEFPSTGKNTGKMPTLLMPQALKAWIPLAFLRLSSKES